MNSKDIIVCSFYTNDDYYRGHAEALRESMSRLGIRSLLQVIEKADNEEWPDICRKKVPFLARVCDDNPDKKVFWIDVDCDLLDLPEFVSNFSADLIGFQRGFGSPLTIGYSNRTRFWEPCFFGINSTRGGRRFIDDAKELEAASAVRATDDYFFEESWRANAAELSFQLVPSQCVLSRASQDSLVPAFFSFGSSGQVQQFKDKVKQHDLVGNQKQSEQTEKTLRSAALRAAKSVDRRLPMAAGRRLRKFADTSGITAALTGGVHGLKQGGGGKGAPHSPHSLKLVEQMLLVGQRGEVENVDLQFARIMRLHVPTTAERYAKVAAESFAHYARKAKGRTPIPLMWWPRPFPGNFGDWLSPLVISNLCDHPLTYVSPTAKDAPAHLVGIGSIGRFIRPESIVVGTGVSSTDYLLDRAGTYHSLRGPITAKLLRESGGPSVESFGDPGLLLSRVLPIKRDVTNGRLAFIRHYTHAKRPIALPDDVDELSVLMSKPGDIQGFLARINEYDGVVTSAMHVMIACHSYGIPCALVGFEGYETAVHGTGLKYRDYSIGAELESVWEPMVISFNLKAENLRGRLSAVQIGEAKLIEIEEAVRASISTVLDRITSTALATE